MLPTGPELEKIHPNTSSISFDGLCSSEKRLQFVKSIILENFLLRSDEAQTMKRPFQVNVINWVSLICSTLIYNDNFKLIVFKNCAIVSRFSRKLSKVISFKLFSNFGNFSWNSVDTDQVITLHRGQSFLMNVYCIEGRVFS